MSTIPTIGFISLGCPKATVDSENILTQLRAEGYVIVSDYADAQLVIINTCGFINPAIEESLSAIEEALDENGQVIVTGCLGKHVEFIKNRFPAVLAVTGPNVPNDVLTAVHHFLPPQHHPHDDLIPPGGIKLTPRHYAYIKIAEGCNQQCTFCIIPQLRGHLISRSVGDILNEAQRLAEVGVKELILVAQDTAAYGADMRYKLDFWQGRPVKTGIKELAEQLGQLGIWIRLHYVYPYPHVEYLVELMAEGIILPYLDMPLQHASPRILKLMRRPVNNENVVKRIAHWRRICPELILRSTFIVGFPQETEEEFQTLLDFVSLIEFDRAGAFSYSPVEGASANLLPEQISESVKAERLDTLMTLQTNISADKLWQRVGRTETVLIDEVTPETIYARSAGEAPEIDGAVILPPRQDNALQPGDFVSVKFVNADEHDLYGQWLDGHAH